MRASSTPTKIILDAAILKAIADFDQTEATREWARWVNFPQPRTIPDPET